jgi:20S proteasome alpha/beta subunit
MCYFDCFQEDLNMTLQVALVGNDGFVIATDTKASTDGGPLAPVPNRNQLRRSSSTPKMVVSDSKKLVCVFSGEQTVGQLARRLINYVNENPGLDLSNCLEEKITERLGSFETVRSKISGNLIAAIPAAEDGIPKLYHVTILEGQALCQPILDRVVDGDRRNPAQFFVERYYTPDKTVEELKFLAAHTVLEGGRLNPTTVGGLEVLVSKNGKTVSFLRDEELQVLRDRSQSLHNTITTELFG